MFFRFLPSLAKLHSAEAIKTELQRVIKWVAMVLSFIALLIFISREWLIMLLYSPAFLSMKVLFGWQLLGDIFKVLAYVFGYLVIAKARLTLYLLAELIQLGLLVGIGYLLIPQYGAVGAVQTYCLTYLCYLIVCIAVFMLYLKRSSPKQH